MGRSHYTYSLSWICQLRRLELESFGSEQRPVVGSFESTSILTPLKSGSFLSRLTTDSPSLAPLYVRRNNSSGSSLTVVAGTALLLLLLLFSFCKMLLFCLLSVLFLCI
jgi:hypothetical protein